MTIQEILSKLSGGKQSGKGYIARCPAHDDNHASLSITEGDGGKILLNCHANCDTEQIVTAIGLQMKDLFPAKELSAGGGKLPLPKGVKPEAEYLYYNYDGYLVHKTIRYGKQYDRPFSQARPHPTNPKTWLHNLNGINTLIYKLPQVAEAIKAEKPIFIVEGEKDADNMEKLGFTATTCPMGAGKWRKHHSEYLRKAIVCIIPDNDTPGKQHAETVAASLFGKAKTVKILDLLRVYPNLQPKGDVSDLIKEVGDTEAVSLINDLAQNTPELKPPADAVKRNAPEERERLKALDMKLNEYFKSTGYFVVNCSLWRHTNDGDKFLANFVPIPTAMIKKDNGIDCEMHFKIRAVGSLGKELPETCISAEKFSGMQWITLAWGFDANYAPGSTTKDYIRYAITAAGKEHATHENIYTHTGFRKIEGKWFYLYNGGAIGKENITVTLDGGLERYFFNVSDGRSEAETFNTSWDFTEAAPEQITLPLISMVYLSPLNEFLRQVKLEPAFIIFLLGLTGAMKSTLAALALCHFGQFSNKTLPASFKDTPNALEKKGFLLKDVLTVIDDYHPSLQRADASKMERTAQEITRSYGDRTGRGRMNSDTTLKTSYIPRGNLIITGEDIPNIGQSGTARHFILELRGCSKFF